MKKTIVLAIIAAMLLTLTTGCMGASAGTGVTPFNATKELLSYSEQAQVKGIAILNGAGQIKVSLSESDNIEVVCEARYSGESRSDFIRKTEALALSPQIVGDILYLEATVTADDGVNYWCWLENNIDVDHIKVDYEIKVPERLTQLSIVNAVGEISVNDTRCGLLLETYTGDVICKNVTPVNVSKIKVSVGNIDFSAADISGAIIISNTVGVGNINMRVPDKSVYKTDNTIAGETTFEVDRKTLFSENQIDEYRKFLTQPAETDFNTDGETVVGNAVNIGTIKLK